MPSLYVPPGDIGTEYGAVSLTPEQQTYYNTLSPRDQASYAAAVGYAKTESGAPGSNPQMADPNMPSSPLGGADQPYSYATITAPYEAAHAAYLATPEGQAWKTQQDYNASPEGIAAKLASDTQAWEGTPAGQQYFQEYQGSNPNATEEQAYQALQGGETLQKAQEADPFYQGVLNWLNPNGFANVTERNLDIISGPNKDLWHDLLTANEVHQNIPGGPETILNFFQGATPDQLKLGADPDAWSAVVAAYNKGRSDTGTFGDSDQSLAAMRQNLQDSGWGELSSLVGPYFTLRYV